MQKAKAGRQPFTMLSQLTLHDILMELMHSPAQQPHVHVQVGMFQVLLLQRTPQRAYKVLQPLEPFMPFRDPSMGASLFDLTVYHCLCVSTSAIHLALYRSLH